VDTLARHGKALPHGDCFGVGAGGHFLTAGWDLILARLYGLGCQSVIGGRVVLWDGSIVDVDEKNHPNLLYVMRGGAATGAGVVTEIRLRLIDEPALATWRFTRISREQLGTCVAKNAFANAFNLPREVSVSFRFHFEPD
jgi:FAD/FMN-containing dehydrogenase